MFLTKKKNFYSFGTFFLVPISASPIFVIVSKKKNFYCENLLFFYSRSFKTKSSQFCSLKNTEADLSDQYFYKDRHFDQLMRLKSSAQEEKVIIIYFCKYWRTTDEWFRAYWRAKDKESLTEFPQIFHIRETIEQYPTDFLRITKFQFLNEIKFENFLISFKKIELLPFNLDKNLFFLEQKIDLSKILFLKDNLHLIRSYYEDSYNVFFKDLKFINFSSLRIKNSFAGTFVFFQSFETTLLVFTNNVTSQAQNSIICSNVKYEYTNTLFLTPLYSGHSNKEICEAASSKQIFPNLLKIFNYGELPYELVSFLTADLYISIGYMEDIFDILYQFFSFSKLLNPPVERPSVKLKFFKKFVENKKKFLSNWEKSYNIERELIIFICEQYLRGKHVFCTSLLKQLPNPIIDLEEEKEFISIYNALLYLQYELLPFIFSFGYRQCKFIALLNNKNVGLKNALVPFTTDKTFVQYGLLDLAALQDAHATLVEVLKKNNVLEKFLKEGLNIEPEEEPHKKLFNDLDQAGFPCFENKEGWNFNNVVLLIEKQLQIAIFQSLLELLPQLKLQKLNLKNHYNLFFLHRDHQKFFIPKQVLTFDDSDLQHFLLKLANKVYEKTGYKLTFKKFNLLQEKEDFKKKILSKALNNNNNQPSNTSFIKNTDTKAFIHQFTEGISLNKKNLFIEFDTSVAKLETSTFFLSFLEIDLCIHYYFPLLTIHEIQKIRYDITQIFYKNNFKTTRVYDSKSIKTNELKSYLENKGFVTFVKDNSFTINIRGIQGVRLNNNIFDIFSSCKIKN